MNPLIRLGLKIASLPIFSVEDSYEFIRDAQTNMALNKLQREEDKFQDFYLIDHYLTSNDQESQIPIRVFSPKNRDKKDLIIFIHGGGFVTGNIDTYTGICYELSQSLGLVIFSIDYRLAPEYKFPIGLEDCYGVCYEILKHFKDDPMDRDIYIMGDSAGANIATVVARLLYERESIEIDGQILIYPAMGYDYSQDFAQNGPFPSLEEKGYDYGLTLSKMEEYYNLYLEDKSLMKKDPNVSPLASNNLSILPRTLLITAEYDPLLDEGRAYGKKLEENNVETSYHMVEGVPHGFFTRTNIFADEHQEVLKYLGDFLNNGQ